MASTSNLFISSTRPFEPIRRMVQPSRTSLTTTSARRRGVHDRNFGRRNIVDENMIILRTRIREMERDDEAPVGWMDWEKDIYGSYDMIICDVMRFLQSHLMDTRPSLALGMVGLIALSLPISTAVILFNLLELCRGILTH